MSEKTGRRGRGVRHGDGRDGHITREELNDVDEVAGVATIAELVKSGGTTLFI